MPVIRYDGKEIEVATNWRLSEQSEAEDALDLDFAESKSGARMRIALYISIRRVTPEDKLPRWQLADAVNNIEMGDMREGDAGPPPVAAALNGSAKDSEDDGQLTTGNQPTVPSST